MAGSRETWVSKLGWQQLGQYYPGVGLTPNLRLYPTARPNPPAPTPTLLSLVEWEFCNSHNQNKMELVGIILQDIFVVDDGS